MLQLLALVFSIVSVTQVRNPRPDHWVTDQANVLDIGTEDKLNTLAETLYRTKKIELAIVVVDDVRETPKQFATALFNHWKIGNAQTNTGVLVLLVMGKRRLEIETGTGIEAALPAAWLADMQARDMVPRFKQKNFPGGLVAGVQAIHDHLAAAPGEGATEQTPGEYRDNGSAVDPGSAAPPRLPPTTVQPVAPQERYVAPPTEEDDGVPVGPLAAGGAGLLGIGGGAALFARHRKRQRTCMKCQPNVAMLPLGEIEDDQHLEAGQQKEEQLGSVDYEVVVCPTCQDARTLRHNKWFSGFSRCSSCSFKTLSSSSNTIVHATYDHGGQVKVTEDCRHCSYHNTYTRYTSKKTRPSTSTSSFSSSSSSRSSGGGSFGGGSSRGGGAGSSW
jgi:uncharacterized protein